MQDTLDAVWVHTSVDFPISLFEIRFIHPLEVDRVKNCNENRKCHKNEYENSCQPNIESVKKFRLRILL